MRKSIPAVFPILLLFGACVSSHIRKDVQAISRQVMDVERAFARSMKDRDFEAFKSFLSREAIFFQGEKVLRGKEQVAEAWRRYYEKIDPPFSWEPEKVEVLDSGKLALSTGPVRSPKGEVIGVFNSIWRLEPPGTWRVVFDKGSQVCP